jgi:signal transduction histidine kinase
MKIYESHSEMYRYKHLPAFAKFILDNHLDGFVRDQLRFSREMDIPILQQLKHLTDEDIVAFSKISAKEYFTYLCNNQGKEHIQMSLEKWRQDQLQVIGKFEITAEDITTINYVRGKALKKWARVYGKTIDDIYNLCDEIDNFLFGYTTSGATTYIDILKTTLDSATNVLNKREEQLLEAQAIAKLGSFEWGLVENSSAVTPQLRHIFEISEHQPFQEFMKHVHPADREKVEKEIGNSYTTGTYDCEYRYLALSGEKNIWARGAVVFKEGKPVLMKGTVQDITERKKIEIALIEKTIELQRRNESLEHFAYVASHDLKEPLRKIALFSDKVLSAEKEKLSEISQKNLLKAQESSIRMQQMIDDILNFSSIQNGEQKQCTQLQILVNEVVEMLEQTIKEKNAVIIKDDLPKVSVIPSQFRQLLQNLIANGIKFSKKGIAPVINITHTLITTASAGIKPSDKYLQINIKDNGIGFDQKYSEKIFELFGRLHPKGSYEGTGLGLSICKKIIENHGGQITSESTVGEGSTFSITIPFEEC